MTTDKEREGDGQNQILYKRKEGLRTGVRSDETRSVKYMADTEPDEEYR